ncbi:MAG TPA: hypothetical protein VFW05_14545 [Verrucomicrobiae bacterium]|nr:hypothetical protein [Verrucomicrobiae bacterium]
MWKIILATVVIFVAGIVTGGLLVGYSDRAHFPGKEIRNVNTQTNAVRGTRLPPPLMGPLRKDFVDKLQRELKMDTAQRERIEKIICDGQEQTRTIWEQVEPEIHETLVETKNKICSELTAEQRVRFDECFKSKSRSSAKSDKNNAAAEKSSK